MLEVLVCDDEKIVSDTYKNKNIPFEKGCLLIRAMLKDECLGLCLFKCENEKAFIIYVEPEQDKMLADGLLRSALHVACCHGVTEAFYTDKHFEKLFQSISFLDNIEEKRLKLNNLYNGCCNCEEKNNNK